MATQADTRNSKLTHATRGGPKTVCGRLITKDIPEEFDTNNPNSCGRCISGLLRESRET